MVDEGRVAAEEAVARETADKEGPVDALEARAEGEKR